MKNVTSFLKKLGLKTEQITQLTSEEEVDIDPIFKAVNAQQRVAITNDPTFIDEITSSIRGTELSKAEHKIRKTFGLGPEDVKDKKFDEIISIAFEKTKSSVSGTTEELQNRLVAATAENKRLLEEVIPAKENEAKSVISSFKKDAAIRSFLLGKAPLLTTTPEVLLPAINLNLATKYNIDVDQEGKIVVKTKANLDPLSKDGTKVIGFDDILNDHIVELGVLKQSNAGAGGQGGAGKPGSQERKEFKNEEPKFNLPGLKAASDNIEAMKNMKTFGS